MKKLLLPAFTIMLILPPAIAQRRAAGILGGVTVCQVDGDPYNGYYKAGFWAGTYFEKKIFDDFSMRSELRFIQKGSSDGNQIEGTNTYYRMVLHYLEIPFLAQYHYGDNLVLEAGPGLGCLLASREKDENGILYDVVPFNRLELSAGAGARYRFIDRFSLVARFSYSVLRIRKHAGGGTWYTNRGQYNNHFSFGVEYRLTR